MKVAKIAAAPKFRNTGRRLPSSPQANPPTASTAIIMQISPGNFPPLPVNHAITASSTKKTGRGSTPMRNSMSFHQPSGQKRPTAGGLTPSGRTARVGGSGRVSMGSGRVMKSAGRNGGGTCAAPNRVGFTRIMRRIPKDQLKHNLIFVQLAVPYRRYQPPG